MTEKMLAEQDHKNAKGTSAKIMEETCQKYYKTKIKLGELFDWRKRLEERKCLIKP